MCYFGSMNNVQSMDLKSVKQNLVDQIKDFGTLLMGHFQHFWFLHLLEVLCLFFMIEVQDICVRVLGGTDHGFLCTKCEGQKDLVLHKCTQSLS
jgi:hypothetical protein